MASYMNYSELQPLETSIPSLSTLFQDNQPNNPHTQELIEMKETILDIINNQSEITISEEDLKNEEIEGIIEKVQGLTPNFQKLQNELSEIDKQYKDEVNAIKKKISTIDSMISFIRQISYSNIDESDLKEMIEKMKVISQKILTNQTLTTLRESYIKKQKELQPHFSLIKYLNQWNVANMCPICFKGKVTHFLNPCGHTGCKDCLERNRRETLTNNQLPQSDSTFECAFCRTQISSIKPLFFL